MELFASQYPRSYSLYFDLNIWFRTRKVTGTFEKRAPLARFCTQATVRVLAERALWEYTPRANGERLWETTGDE